MKQGAEIWLELDLSNTTNNALSETVRVVCVFF